MITNRWGEVEPVVHDLPETTVFRGREGAAYSHHPQVTVVDGTLVATWSNGRRHEDDVGQRMLLATSPDGDAWSEPVAVASPADTLAEDPARAVVTGMGVRATGERLVAYYGVYEYAEDALEDGHRPSGSKAATAGTDRRYHRRSHTEARISRDGGRTWGDPDVVVEGFVPNHPPSRAGDLLVMPGNMCYPHTGDDAGLSGWTRACLPGLPEGYVDDPEGFHRGAHHRGERVGDDTGYCEGSFFRVEGGLRMMLRTGEDHLAVTESDDGRSWSEPRPTAYTDCASRPLFGNLPDGRPFGLTCPEPGSARTPLVLAASDDGEAFDDHHVLGDDPATGPRFEGLHKGGRYGYPSACVHDDHLQVVYSVHKEDVAAVRLPLDAL